MDCKEFVNRLRNHRVLYKCDYEKFSGGACTADCVDAADIIEQYARKINELDKQLSEVVTQKDKAIETLETIIGLQKICVLCGNLKCKESKSDVTKCEPKWNYQ